jgi:hypothetical protein
LKLIVKHISNSSLKPSLAAGTRAAKRILNLRFFMKASATSLALVRTIALPLTAIATVFAAGLPAAFGLDEALGLFVAALTGLTLAADHARRPAGLGAARSLGSHAIATEERRLAT